MRAIAPIDYHLVSVELLRELRGRRSQTSLSRRIGYKSNIVHRWESQQCWPAAFQFMKVCQQLGKDVQGSYAHLFRRRPGWLDTVEADSPEAVAAFLRDLRGKTPIIELAAKTGINRYTISRWLRGVARPNLPQMLQMIDATSRRLLDFLSTLVDPSRLPSVSERWEMLERTRQLAYEEPWSHAVLRALQLGSCPRRTDRQVAFIASRLDLSRPAVLRLLDVLRQAGHIERVRGRWKAGPVVAVDTGNDTAEALALKATWARVATERLEARAPGSFGYSLFEVSASDLRKLRDLHLEYLRAMLSIVANSEGTECVGLYVAHLMDMATAPDNALLQRR